MKLRHVWPNSKAIAWYFSEKCPNLKLIDVDCRLKSDENEALLGKR